MNQKESDLKEEERKRRATGSLSSSSILLLCLFIHLFIAVEEGATKPNPFGPLRRRVLPKEEETELKPKQTKDRQDMKQLLEANRKEIEKRMSLINTDKVHVDCLSTIREFFSFETNFLSHIQTVFSVHFLSFFLSFIFFFLFFLLSFFFCCCGC